MSAAGSVNKRGTLYGVSGFAGMVQVFRRNEEDARGHLTAGTGSFSDVHGSGGYQFTGSEGLKLRVEAAGQHSDGWQDRTGSDLGRGSVMLSRPVGRGTFGLTLSSQYDSQQWGSPLAMRHSTCLNHTTLYPRKCSTSPLRSHASRLVPRAA